MVNKVAVKELIEFSRYSERRKSSFAQKLKVPKEPNPDGGGDYWISCISALSDAFKKNSTTPINTRLDELYAKAGNPQLKRTQTKNMYERNINVLSRYTDFGFGIWRPDENSSILEHKSSEPIVIDGISLRATPNQVFSFGDKDHPSVGAIRFVIWQDGFSQGDLGMFSETTYRYLSNFYGNRYTVDTNYCLTVDASNIQAVSYAQVQDGRIQSKLNDCIANLVRYL